MHGMCINPDVGSANHRLWIFAEIVEPCHAVAAVPFEQHYTANVKSCRGNSAWTEDIDKARPSFVLLVRRPSALITRGCCQYFGRQCTLIVWETTGRRWASNFDEGVDNFGETRSVWLGQISQQSGPLYVHQHTAVHHAQYITRERNPRSFGRLTSFRLIQRPPIGRRATDTGRKITGKRHVVRALRPLAGRIRFPIDDIASVTPSGSSVSISTTKVTKSALTKTRAKLPHIVI